jgi:hypothetical protein
MVSKRMNISFPPMFRSGSLSGTDFPLFYVITTKTHQPPFIHEKRHGFDEASHSRASSNMGNNAISRTPGFPPSRE